MENPFLHCFDFTTKTACVTGASSGIGRAAATLLAGLGAVVHVADRDSEGLETLVASRPEAFRPFVYDQANRESVESLARAVGPVDVLVNNAGILLYEPLINLKWEDLERNVATIASSCMGTIAGVQRSPITSNTTSFAISARPMQTGNVTSARPSVTSRR